jgi:hypothetical protein
MKNYQPETTVIAVVLCKNASTSTQYYFVVDIFLQKNLNNHIHMNINKI